MTEVTASGSSRVAAFDDTSWKVKITVFQQYLVDCHEALAVSQTRYKGIEECKGTDVAKAQKPKAARKIVKMSGVYLLPAGATREPVTASSSRHFVAPLWASLGDASERERAA